MEALRSRIMQFARVGYILVEIGFVAGIVGACVCGVGLIWALAMGDPSASLVIGGVTLLSPVDMGGQNLAVFCGMMAYTVAYCGFLIAIMRLMMRLFGNMRDHYTPFTPENAKLLTRAAILTLVASIVPAAAGQAAGQGCAKLLSLPFEEDYGNGVAMVTAGLFLMMSLVFKYGCALQEQADTTL